MMGLDPTTTAKRMSGLGADVIGFICGSISYADSTEVLREMKAACRQPLFPKPNAGIPQLQDGKTVYPSTPEELGAITPAWIGAGARLIGGCCGTTPEHIAKVAEAVREYGS
jgi:5-methyltetrahydrofolate--homocysteine methyltransferase